jgi:hypothetical protein
MQVGGNNLRIIGGGSQKTTEDKVETVELWYSILVEYFSSAGKGKEI